MELDSLASQISLCNKTNGACYQCEVYSLSCPKVIYALNKSACELGQLTRREDARVTCGNMNE